MPGRDVDGSGERAFMVIKSNGFVRRKNLVEGGRLRSPVLQTEDARLG